MDAAGFCAGLRPAETGGRRSEIGDWRLEIGLSERRSWSGESGEWVASLDRLRGKCGACTEDVWLHLDAPDGRRFTYAVRPDTKLDELDEAALRRLADRATSSQ